MENKEELQAPSIACQIHPLSCPVYWNADDVLKQGVFRSPSNSLVKVSYAVREKINSLFSFEHYDFLSD